MGDVNLCYLCDKEFMRKRTLRVHLKDVHKIQPDGSVKCPKYDCGFLCSCLADLRIHARKEHLVPILEEKIVFKSWEDFLKWKDGEEKATRSSFIKQKGAKRMKDGTEKITFICHRSGKFTSKSEGKRLQRSQGSSKLGSHCTAAIELTRNESGTCAAVYFRTHFGHEQQIAFLPLSRFDREAIAGKLAEGVTMQRILDDVRESVQTEEVQRIHLITRKDLHNIKRDFCIESHHHGNDEVSVGATVEQIKSTVTEETPAILSSLRQEHDQGDTTQEKELHSKFKALAGRALLHK